MAQEGTMSTETRMGLHALVDQLSDEQLAEVLAYARWLVSEDQIAPSQARLAAFREWFDDRPRD
jgi:hypothetical protein